LSDDASPYVLIEQPNIEISAVGASILFCGDGKMPVTVFNNNASSDPGPASTFSKDTLISGNAVTVKNVTAGYCTDRPQW
jgi:hypothetical protein